MSGTHHHNHQQGPSGWDIKAPPILLHRGPGFLLIEASADFTGGTHEKFRYLVATEAIPKGFRLIVEPCSIVLGPNVTPRSNLANNVTVPAGKAGADLAGVTVAAQKHGLERLKAQIVGHQPPFKEVELYHEANPNAQLSDDQAVRIFHNNMTTGALRYDTGTFLYIGTAQLARFLNHHHGAANCKWELEFANNGVLSVVTTLHDIKKNDILSINYGNFSETECICPPCRHKRREL